MERLKQLTEQLINLKDITEDSVNGLREYKVKQGNAFATALKHNREVAVAQAFMSAGTIFPYHVHENATEVIVVYSGKVTIVTDESRSVLTVGDSIHICAGCGHTLHAITDTKVIAITIPPDADALPKMKNYAK